MATPVTTRLEGRAWWILVALIAVGAFLRLVDLGTLSFRWDEDLSSLAAKAIAEQGVPELPSGMIYLRSGAFLYLLATSGELLGFSEGALRLPAALFGIAIIPLSFLFGKRLFGTGVGLIVAALVTFSVWDIEFSRYARMYAPFEFFYLLTLLCIWRYRIVEQSTAGGWLCVIVGLVAISLHDLGYTLALVFLVPPLLDGRKLLAEPRRLAFPATAFILVATFFFAWERMQSRYYNRAADQGEGIAASASITTNAQPEPAGALGFLQSVLSQARFPELPSFSVLAESFPLAAAAMVAVPLLAVGVFCLKHRRGLPAISWLALPFIALCCGIQLFNIALLAVLALAFVRSRGIEALRDADIRFSAILIAVSFTVWLALTLHLDLFSGGEGDSSGNARDAIRQLLNFPSFFVFWGFAREYPLMSIPALVGGLWAFDRAAREPAHAASFFLLLVFAIPMVLNGLFETKYQSFRYNVPFGPLFFAFVALGIVKWRHVLAAWNAGKAPTSMGHPASALVTSALVAAVLVFDMNPLRSWLATQRAYTNEGPLYALFGLRGFRDFRSAAGYVAEHAGQDDIIITFDCREYFNYLDRLDYCIVSQTYRDGDDLIQTYIDDGARRDLYLSTPMVMDTSELQRLLQGTDATKWLLASDSTTRPGRISDDLRRFLAMSEGHVVHVARDGETKVYRF